MRFGALAPTLSKSGCDRGHSTPIEQIIDSDGQSLNIGIPGSEGVDQEARSYRRVFQPNKFRPPDIG